MSSPQDFEQDKVDALLRRSMAAPAPELSANFEAELARRMQPRRLDARARWALIVYAALSLIVSVGLMRWSAIEWGWIAAAVAAPVVLTGILLRRGQMVMSWMRLSSRSGR